jgi:hypothetical protein
MCDDDDEDEDDTYKGYTTWVAFLNLKFKTDQ